MCVQIKKVLKGINDLWTTHPNIAKLLKFPEEGYSISHGSKESHIFICPDCNYEKPYQIYKITNYKFSCSKCGDGISYPNKFAFNLLEQLGIDFISEHKFLNYKLDFYFELNGIKYNLEMDGGLGHGHENKMTKQTAEESQILDDTRDKLIKEYNIEVIRIDCFKSDLEYIKNNILNSKLVQLFKLNNVDWNVCNEFALSNRLKETCILWNNGIKNTLDVSKIMKLDKSTIIRYLKIGTELNLCYYNAKEEVIKSSSVLGKIYGKINGSKRAIPIIQLSLNGEYIAEFKSASEANSQLNISNSSIIACCRKKLNSVGNFIWLYKNDYNKKNNNISYKPRLYPTKIIIQLSLDNVFIKEWDSIKEAGREFNIKSPNIIACCQGKLKTSGKFKWMYKEDYDKYIENKNNIA